MLCRKLYRCDPIWEPDCRPIVVIAILADILGIVALIASVTDMSQTFPLVLTLSPWLFRLRGQSAEIASALDEFFSSRGRSIHRSTVSVDWSKSLLDFAIISSHPRIEVYETARLSSKRCLALSSKVSQCSESSRPVCEIATLNSFGSWWVFRETR